MPSLIKFISFLLVTGALIFGGMFALATFVEPKPRDMSFNVPADKLNKADPR